MSGQSVGYIALLRRNRAYRRLWYGQVVSQLGDWFSSVALYALLYELTGSATAVDRWHAATGLAGRGVAARGP